MDLLTTNSSEIMLILIAIIGIMIVVWMFGLWLKVKAGGVELSAELSIIRIN